MPIDKTANAMERSEAARKDANQKTSQIALRRWQYPWAGLPEQPIDIPDMLAASESAEPSGEEP
jgi:hypothetical protein